jgi:membrane-associated phospholipid phosphatase
MPNANRHCREFLLPAILALTAFAALSVDLRVAATLTDWRATKWHDRWVVRDYLGYFDMFEPFGHGLGLALALLALHQLDPGRRWAIPRVFLCAAGSGGAANLLKMALARSRPEDALNHLADSVWATFHLDPWPPLWRVTSEWQSFPSAHTAQAVGLAAALIWLYPQGRWFFGLLAVLVGCQRIASMAHFSSDVLFGAAVGCLVATLVLRVGRLPAWFDRWESGWGKL